MIHMATSNNAGQQMCAQALLGPGMFGPVVVPRPREEDLGPEEVLLAVLAGGICGSDGPFFRGAPNRRSVTPTAGTGGGAPGFPMHEVVGEVIASTDPDVEPGSRVVGWASRSDGIAEYLVTDSKSLSRYDVALSPEQAVLIQPLACVLYALERVGDVAGRSCAVVGLGPIGLLFSHVLKERGATRVVGIDPIDRSEIAKDFGLDEFMWTTSQVWSGSLTDADRPEVVVEAVGHQISTLQHAISAVADSGRIFYFGIPDDDFYPIDMEDMVRKNLALMAGGTRHRPRMLSEANEYLRQHPELIENTITHTFVLDDVQQAYHLACTPAVGRLKVVVSIS